MKITQRNMIIDSRKTTYTVSDIFYLYKNI